MSVVIKDQYNEQLRLFREVNRVEKALISQIVSAINAEFLTAIRNRATMTQQQTIANAYIILNKGGLLKEEVKTWNILQAAHKTWIAFKIHFRRAHNEYRKTINTTL